MKKKMKIFDTFYDKILEIRSSKNFIFYIYILLFIICFLLITGQNIRSNPLDDIIHSEAVTKYGSAYNLMLQLLHEFEGGGTVYQNSAGEDCYKVLNVEGNMTVGYGIDITVNPQWKSQLEEQMGSSITFGTLVPCKYVDAI